MQPRSLLPFLLLVLGVSAVPAPHVKRDDAAPNYVNEDGSIDFSALTADAAIVPTIVAPAQASNVILPIDTQAISEDVVSQASDQADSVPAKRDLEKRAPTPAWAGFDVCAPQKLFTQAKVSSPDTPAAFKADSAFSQAAVTAAKPNGYTLEYVALNGVYQSSGANSYLGSRTLTSAQGYNPQICADYCSNNVKGCLGFNIYFERDPPIDFAAVKPENKAKCNNPPSVTQIACQFYGSSVNAAAATSTGQFRSDYFQTAKAGSNGYSKSTVVPKAIDGFNAPLTFGEGKIDNQKVAGKIAGTHLLTVNPDFSAQYCADVAEKFYADKYTSFETFMLKKNGVYVGQGCIVLTEGGFTTGDAHDAGQFGGRSDTYDETKVWFSSQPVYYYEKVPKPASGEGITFDRDQIDDLSTAFLSNGGQALQVTSVQGFTMQGRSNRSPGVLIWHDNPYALGSIDGPMATCTNAGPCNLFPADSHYRFDLKRADLGDMGHSSGLMSIAGYRNGLEVARYEEQTDGKWHKVSFPASFSNLDSVQFTTPLGVGIDNLVADRKLRNSGRRSISNGATVAANQIRRQVNEADGTFTAKFMNGTVVTAPQSCSLVDLAESRCDFTTVSE